MTAISKIRKVVKDRSQKNLASHMVSVFDFFLLKEAVGGVLHRASRGDDDFLLPSAGTLLLLIAHGTVITTYLHFFFSSDV